MAESLSKPSTCRERLQKALPAVAGIVAAFTLMHLPHLSMPPEPVHNSAFTGQMWIQELVEGI